jgi:hypothetical protein
MMADPKHMEVKLNIALGCKTWYSIALEFPLEVLILDASERCLAAAGRDTSRWPPSPAAPLRYVRQIEVREACHASQTESPFAALGDFVQQCPSLLAYRHWINYRAIGAYLSSLFTHGSQSLRRLDLSECDLPYAFGRLLTAGMPRLEYLSLSGMGNCVIAPDILTRPMLLNLGLSFASSVDPLTWESDTASTTNSGNRLRRKIERNKIYRLSKVPLERKYSEEPISEFSRIGSKSCPRMCPRYDTKSLSPSPFPPGSPQHQIP